MKFLYAVCAVFVLTASLQAQSVESSRIEPILEEWLNGSDHIALPSLAGLASEGDLAAQIFLGTIAPETYLHSDVTGDLSRVERLTLLRVPGGLSGNSWLKVAAQQDEFALTLSGTLEVHERESAITALLPYGETRYLLSGLLANYSHGNWAFTARTALSPALAPYATPLGIEAALTLYTSNSSQGLDVPDDIATVLLHHLERDESLDFLSSEWGAPDANTNFETYGARLAQNPGMVGPVTLCTAACPQSINPCLSAMQLARGSGQLLIANFSPVEALISSEAYQSSDRFAGDILAFLRNTPFPPSAIRRVDQCAADLIFE